MIKLLRWEYLRRVLPLLIESSPPAPTHLYGLNLVSCSQSITFGICSKPHTGEVGFQFINRLIVSLINNEQLRTISENDGGMRFAGESEIIP